MTSLPNAVPSDRTITDGFFYLAQQEFREGGSFRKVYGQELEQVGIKLTFENIDDAIAAEFLEAYEAARGALQPVTLPEGFLSGLGPELQELLTDSGQWFIENPVAIESVQAGVSTVQLELVREVSERVLTVVRPSAPDLFSLGPLAAFRVKVYATSDSLETVCSYAAKVSAYIAEAISVEGGVTGSYPVGGYES